MFLARSYDIEECCIWDWEDELFTFYESLIRYVSLIIYFSQTFILNICLLKAFFAF